MGKIKPQYSNTNSDNLLKKVNSPSAVIVMLSRRRLIGHVFLRVPVSSALALVHTGSRESQVPAELSGRRKEVGTGRWGGGILTQWRGAAAWPSRST